MTPTLPTGTVTFLLTDVEETAEWERDRVAMAAAVVRHYEILDAAIRRHGGVRPPPTGDGDSVVAAFSSAVAALRAAVEVALAPLAEPLRIRMALHTGEAHVRDAGSAVSSVGPQASYVGRAIDRAARLRAAGHGRQILCSRTTADLVRDDLPDTVGLLDLGSHRLNDLERPERVFQVTHPLLPREFDRLRSLEAVPNNLPVHLTSFIGREREQAEVASLARSHRLVTVTGAGGAGKTRLAARVAADLAADHGDGAWWVELAPVADPALVPDAVLAALGVADAPDRNGLQRLTAHLATRDVLLVLDNCEHLVAAAAGLADSLLRGAPLVRVLATSREPLGVGGEVTWQVPPLELPNLELEVAVASLGSYEAVRLFVDRAVQARPNFAVTNATAPVIAEICARLDGIPLAIELAAARARVLSPGQILDGLADRFGLLTGGSRHALPRQQTLEASVAWSHAQLSDDERAAFRRLAVFSGGFGIDGAEAVASLGGAPEPVAVLDLLDSLAAKSLVVVEELAGQARYRLLETLRQFAARELDRAGETSPTRDAHLRHCRTLAALAVPRLLGVDAATVHELDADQDNFRAALEWAIAGGDSGGAHEIAYPHAWLLNLRGRYREVCETSARVLALKGESVAGRCHALWSLGLARWSLGDLHAVQAATDEMTALGEEADDDRARAYAQSMLSWVQMFWDPREAAATLEAAWEMPATRADPWLAMNVPCDYLHIVVRTDDLDAAEQWFERAQEEARLWNNEYFMAWNHGPEALILMRRGDLRRARVAGERAMELARGLGDQVVISFAAAVVVWVELLSGNPEAAMSIARRALRESAAAADGISRGSLLLGSALAASALGEQDWGAAVAEAELVAERLGDAWQHAWAALVMVDVLVERGEHGAARARIEAARADGTLMDSRWIDAMCDHTQGCLEMARGDVERAEDLQHAALAKAVEGGYALVVVDAVEALADLAACSQSFAEATRLRAAAGRRREELGYRLHRGRRDVEASCREALGEAEFVVARAEGAELDIAAAVAYASRARGSRKRPSSGWGSLTPTELEVARLAATGIGNAAIGEKLFIAAGTAKVHLSSIYAKLGIANRTQLTAEVTRRDR